MLPMPVGMPRTSARMSGSTKLIVAPQATRTRSSRDTSRFESTMGCSLFQFRGIRRAAWFTFMTRGHLEKFRCQVVVERKITGLRWGRGPEDGIFRGAPEVFVHRRLTRMEL